MAAYRETRACQPVAANGELRGYSRRWNRVVSVQPNCFGNTPDSRLAWFDRRWAGPEPDFLDRARLAISSPARSPESPFDRIPSEAAEQILCRLNVICAPQHFAL
jgi:hypothetical protein